MSNKRYINNVPGAPFSIGTMVKIKNSQDETFRRELVGKIGEIVHYDYFCRCGQSFPGDPMIGVLFENGEVEEFWEEEIVLN